jgi:hypothetical protein
MKKISMKALLVALGMTLAASSTAFAQLSLTFDTPGARIGINVPVYPTLQPIPGYPVYYAPGMSSNYFFYDGLFWYYDGVNWYASSWYDGPWSLVDPIDVPVFVLRVPVRYYRAPPQFFYGWAASDAPHWGDHWGASWSERRRGWDQWNRRSAPAAAPLPTYQRQYSGSRYPQAAQQQASIETRSYRYQPRDPVAQQHFQQARAQGSAPAQPQSQARARPEAQARPQAQAPQPVQAQVPPQQRPAQQQQAEHRPAPAPQTPVREQAAPRPQPQPTQAQRPVERPQQQAQAPRPVQLQHAPEQRPQVHEQGKEQPHEQGKEQKGEQKREPNQENK